MTLRVVYYREVKSSSLLEVISFCIVPLLGETTPTERYIGKSHEPSETYKCCDTMTRQCFMFGTARKVHQ